MEEKTMLSEDGRIVRVDNPWCSFYIDTELAPALDESRCGKWMFYFNDIEFAEEVCRKAALGMVVAECVSSRGFEQKEHRKLSSLSIGSAHA
ncbi:hypothetical protein, partial [Collinsella aerofaciens]|uniref:hypothetical protein n=1 Tax=Collinsella aerofaciens TaxID=74426 RepID=UPI00137EFC84